MGTKVTTARYANKRCECAQRVDAGDPIIYDYDAKRIVGCLKCKFEELKGAKPIEVDVRVLRVKVISDTFQIATAHLDTSVNIPEESEWPIRNHDELFSVVGSGMEQVHTDAILRVTGAWENTTRFGSSKPRASFHWSAKPKATSSRS
jgi:hypothetical protein